MVATPPTTARGRAKRDQIRRGARHVFLTQGFADATTDAIARQAGVSKQTLYVYYRTKEQLLGDVLLAVVRELEERRDWHAERLDLDSAASFRDVLVDLAEKVVASLLDPDYIALVRVIISEAPRVPAIAELWSRTVPGRVRGVVADLLGRAAARGVVEVADVEAATRLFVGALLTYVVPDGLLTTGDPAGPPPRARLESVVDLFLHALT